MKITEFEMRGLLTGKCIPGDMKVNEQLPAYLVRKFSSLHQELLDAQKKISCAENNELDARCHIASLQEELAAATNSLTNAQEALKSAGIEADTVQAGVVKLVSRMNRIAAENYDLKHPGTYLPSKRETPATDAYLNAVRAEGLDMAAAEIDRWVGCDLLAREIRQMSINIRAGNAGRDGV